MFGVSLKSLERKPRYGRKKVLYVMFEVKCSTYLPLLYGDIKQFLVLLSSGGGDT
jgi:hypothetical protein